MYVRSLKGAVCSREDGVCFAPACACALSRRAHRDARGKEAGLSNKIRAAAARRPACLATLCTDWVTSISTPREQKAQSAAPPDRRRRCLTD